MKYAIIIFTILGAMFLLGGVASHVQAAYDPLKKLCEDNPEATACIENTKPQGPNNNSIYGKNGILMKITRIVSLAVGVASVIVIIIGGIKYVVSQGDANAVTSAKNTVLYAIIGLVIAASAQAIIVLVLNKL